MAKLEGYTKGWSKISKRIIERAGNCCEECGIENGTIIIRGGRNKGRIVSEEEYLATYEKFLDAQEIVDRKFNEEREKYEREWFNKFLSGEFDLGELGLGVYSEGEFFPFDDDESMGYFDENGILHITGLPPEKDVKFEDLFSALNWIKIVLQVHHKDRNKTNNDEANLVTLCQSCHGAKHPPKSKSLK